MILFQFPKPAANCQITSIKSEAEAAVLDSKWQEKDWFTSSLQLVALLYAKQN